MFYFAYGANLLKSAMRERCPEAVSIGASVLRDHRRVFRSWADIEPAAGAQVAGGLWRITPACLTALDDYEEVEAGLYFRVTLMVETVNGEAVAAFVYRMTSKTYAPPEPGYLADVLRGCSDFGLDAAPVLAAARAAERRQPGP